MSTPDWLDLPLPMTTKSPDWLDPSREWRTWFDRITADLGVPARIFHGEVLRSYRNSSLEPNLSVGEAKFLNLQEGFTKRIVLPMLEAQFPEWFWKPIFLCSPRGRLMVRREEHEIPKITWDGGTNAG